MERRFIYPGSAENRYPSDGVFRTEERSLPYRELRANDHGGYLQPLPPHTVTTDVYSTQPMTRSRNAVPWWTSIGLGLSPSGDGVSRSRNENLESKLSRYYNEDGLVNDSGLLADKNATTLIKKTTESQLWRKISDPKQVILTEVDGKLVWREKNDAYNESKTQTVEVQPSRILRSSMPIVRRTPYMVYA